MKPNFEHTDVQMSNSDAWLQNAMADGVSDAMRISAAFISGYNALLAVQPLYEGPLGDHPLDRFVKNGAEVVGLSEADKDLGLQLRHWEEYAKYQLQPPPVPVDAALEWAQRVRAAAVKLLATP